MMRLNAAIDTALWSNGDSTNVFFLPPSSGLIGKIRPLGYPICSTKNVESRGRKLRDI